MGRFSPVCLSALVAAFLIIQGCGSTPATSTPTAPVKPATPPSLYLSSGTPSRILIYPLDSTGNPSASSTITLSGTSPTIRALAVDSSGNIYAATDTDIREFAAGAAGAATPIRTIPFDSTTTLSGVTAMAVDASGALYVSQLHASPSSASGDILVFSSDENGSVAPIRTIYGSQTLLGVGAKLALDSAGNIYVLNDGIPTFLSYPAGANGNVAPSSSFSRDFNNIAVDPSGNFYALGQFSLDYYSKGASTPSVSVPYYELGYPAFTGLFALDASGNICYLSNGISNVAARYPVPTFYRVTPSGSAIPTLVNSFTPADWTLPFTPNTYAPFAIH